MAAPLTPHQIAVVKSTAPVLKDHAEAITTIFYANLLAANPGLNNIFSITSQTTGRQPRALAGAVLAYATYIDDLPKLAAAVELIAHKHASLQVSAPQYAVVGKFLMEAIGLVLGEAATPEIVEAWTAAYGVLADVFISREAQLYEVQKAHGWVGWRKFRVTRKVVETAGHITSFYLEPVDGVTPLPGFLPGQYVSVQVFVPELGFLQSRQYSLSEAPGAAEGRYYRVSVKREPGEVVDHPGMVSNLLHDKVEVGDEVELSHPQGEFWVDPKDESKKGVPAVLISAGVGATPMMAILRALAPERKEEVVVKRPVSWIQGARSSRMHPFADAVRDVSRDNEQVTANVFLTTVEDEDKEGVDYHFGKTRIDLEKLDADKHLFLGDKRAEYFVCGPELFMIQTRRALVAKGVDEERIRLEVFATGGVAEA
ncbi:globin-like protein [Coniochaeta ligniaria NRRL 30616]|uniref:nitric oxide dioxygenase n=1 Tax=Coniochaeta ligniaria NRRL 30616 TaxID=1408157 RepID=A0A1J7IJU5_9PEZI|nr:globin-like protein [Coniochaeta ligniaria NRRL 30616]